jgi:hypothetical protein
MSIKTSGDFENDPEGALDALDQTGFALFMINKSWFADTRAIMEWRFAKDHKKPMIYIFRDNQEIIKEPLLLEMMKVDSLIGTINDYGDTDRTGVYIQAMIAAYCKDHNIEL